MESEKKTFVRSLRRLSRLIFCIIVTLLFGRSAAYCQGADEFDSLSYPENSSFARAELAKDINIEMLNKNEPTFPFPLANTPPDSIRSVPVPPAGVTMAIFIATMIVGWLRRRNPSDLR
ncbi:MAG: hypothetical protein K9M75_06140 [Phycisphaerae bacterium]|nr:hypothetical protein [Phycisphaerae bacterium]